MNNEPVKVETTIDVPVAHVWKALTDKEEMNAWYFSLEEFKAEPGFEFSFEGGNDHARYMHVCKVLEAIPNQVLKHSWSYDGYAGNSFVTWHLFNEGDAARVLLTHEGLETFPDDQPDFARNNFVEGWNAIVRSSLKNYLEKK